MRRILLTALLLCLGAGDASAQLGPLKKLKDKAKQKVEQRVDQKKAAAEDEIDNRMDRALDGVECLLTDPECIAQAESEGKNVNLKDEDGRPVPGGAAAAKKPGEGAWANYDFVPGEKVLFFDDFANETVGNFPQRMELVEGSGEVVEWPAGSGSRWLRFASSSGGDGFAITLPEQLPERYTIEFDATIPWYGVGIYSAGDWAGGNYNHQKQVGAVVLSGYEVGIARANSDAGSFQRPADLGGLFAKEFGPSRLVRMRLHVDGNYGKLYLDERRVANIPNASMGHSDKVFFVIGSTQDDPMLIGNISINAGGRKLYDALAESGRIAVPGILFDTGKDRIRPESTPTLKEIGDMLKQHADLKLTIEGHTDNVGDDAANQALSQKRADAVRQFLVETYGVDAGRLQAKGLGETKPAAPNETPEGRQQNRRVELVRM